MANEQLKQDARKVFRLVDLTLLEKNVPDESVVNLIKKSKVDDVCVAGICIYAEYLKVGRQALNDVGNSESKLVTVVNFPQGRDPLEDVIEETKNAIEDGAEEVDLVMPYHLVQSGDYQTCQDFVAAIKQACGSTPLKVIIESGELKDPELIAKASHISIEAGAEFIKTSTGKVPVNATPESAKIMVQAIKDSGKNVGFKAAGGVRDLKTALEYIAQSEAIMGRGWVKQDTFRIGASGLVDSLPMHGEEDKGASTSTY